MRAERYHRGSPGSVAPLFRYSNSYTRPWAVSEHRQGPMARQTPLELYRNIGIMDALTKLDLPAGVDVEIKVE